MTEKFTFYDFVGFFIPGAIFNLNIVIIAYFYHSLNLLEFCNGFLGSVIFIISSYIIGHLIQEIGYLITKRYSTYKVRLSHLFLCYSDVHFSEDFKKQLLLFLTSSFLGNETEFNPEDDPRTSTLLFSLCYAFVVDNGIGKRAENYNGLFALSRGLFTVSGICMIIHVGVFFFDIISEYRLSGTIRMQNAYLDSLLMGFVFVIFIIVFKKRFNDYSRRFVDAVYRSFYVYQKTLVNKE